MPGQPISREAYEVSELLVRAADAGRAQRAPGAPDRSPLSPGAIRAAIHLAMVGSSTISELAEHLDISVGWASRVADEMERRGHLVRERSGEDRRVVRVSLSPAARSMIDDFYAWRGRAVGRALAELSPAQRATVTTFLRRAAEELERGPIED